MALFGKKAKDAPSGPAPDDSNGGSAAVATADAPDAPTKGKRAKVAREPKAPKVRKVKNGTAVGLNIGNQYIKAVEVTSKGGELTVTAMGAVPTPPESYTNGNVLSVSALSNAIKDLWRGAGIKSKVAITSVAGTGALVVRVIEVPKMSDGELRDNMKVDADRYIPFPPSEVVMDFKALRDLPSDPDAPNMEVLLAAAQREIIDLHVKVIQGARLDPRAIDVETIAASRALQLERGNSGYIDYNEVTGVVNLGATGSEISIMRGDIVVFTRVVPNGGNSITTAIAEGLGMPFSDAEHVKLVSADALPPAGYGAAPADDFGFGDGGADFNFGSEEFSGGDFNSAFDDISADPNTTATSGGSDDPFDLDFFNQGPAQDEPGAGHAQKEGEDESDAPFSFSFGDEVAPAAPAPVPAPQAPTPPPAAPPVAAPSPGISFDFGDDLSEEYLPTLAEPEAPVAPVAPTADKGTAVLNDFSLDATDTTPLPSVTEVPTVEPLAAPQPSLSESFSSLIPSAFDFDNFDLPGIQEEGLSTVSTPIAAAPPAPPAPAPLADMTPATPPPPAPSDSLPASFDFEDDSLASRHEEEAAAPATFGFAAAPEAAAPVEPEPAATPLGFEPELEPVVESGPTFENPAFEAPAFEAPAFEAPELEVPVDEAPVAAAPVAADPAAAADDDFDLDSIFGDTPAAETNPFASPASDGSGKAMPDSNEFDLDGLETGLGSFAVPFGGQTDDFSTFGTGLADDASETDAATLYSLIQPSLEELSNEVRRSLEFHLGRYPDATISRLVLLGGGAKLRNIDVFFTQSLGVPTVVANPFAHIAVQAPKLPPGYAVENGPLCAVALGLALRDFVD